MFALNRPEVMIGDADGLFDAKGTLTDNDTKERIRNLLQALAKWTRQLRGR
jgi:chromate reductase